jgi:hypothetical protein
MKIWKFRIGEITARYWLKAEEPPHEMTVPEIFVDERPLSEKIRIGRGLAYSNCDFSYDNPEILSAAIDRYTGKRSPSNQFGSKRIVLYRCHCGVDYCGVVSFSLVEEEYFIVWRNLSRESEDGVEDAAALQLDGVQFIEELRFEKAQYFAEFERYRRLRGV